MQIPLNAPCQVENIPCALISLPQWVVWQPEERNGKTTKPPYNPKGGRASVNQPLTWSDFDTAIMTAHAEYGGRVGFVLTEADNFAGMDIDHCVDPETGTITEDALKVIETLNSYTEFSPSGTGIHILVLVNNRGDNENRSRDGNGYEMYHKGRYLTVTGNRVPGTPAEIADRSEEWSHVYDMVFPEPQTQTTSKHREVAAPQPLLPKQPETPSFCVLSDEQVIAKASAAKNGDKFMRLYKHGNTSDYKDDESAADIGLCGLLAFWCGRDSDQQIERLVSQSALGKRDKWQLREDYRERTIKKALENQNEFYSDAGSVSFTFDPQAVNDTEVGNAHRLHKQYGHSIRYITELKKWATWDSGRWHIGDADLVKRMALETVRGIYREAAEADGERRKTLLSHARKSETKRGIDAMVDLVKLLDGIAIRVESLDADPWLLNLSNGTVDLRDGKIREADPADALTEQVPIEFQPHARCPLWEAFLQRVVPDEETRAFLQRAVGYSLTGVVRDHALFFLYGIGKNGKSTFTSVIESLLGDMWTKTRSDVLMLSRFGANTGATPELAKLRGKRLVTVTEIASGARLDEALIKDMTGGDRISARSLYSEPITFNATHKVWMYGNHKPDIKGVDTGIWRRVKLIPFAQVITQEECDPTLGDKLKAELPGILNWAVAGCLEWQLQGLGEPAEVTNATREYRDEMDLIGQFLATVCEVSAGYRVGSTVLYEAFKRYCDDLGEFHKSHKLFSQAVKNRGYSEFRMPDSKMGFQGLRIVPIAGALGKEAPG